MDSIVHQLILLYPLNVHISEYTLKFLTYGVKIKN